MAVPFFVSVIPGVNRVPLGDNATFECMVNGDVHVEQYSWVGPQKIAREARFSYSNDKRFLHVQNLKDYDNNTWVDCTVTAGGGRAMTANGTIVVLSSQDGLKVDGMYNDTITEKIGEVEIPYITAGGMYNDTLTQKIGEGEIPYNTTGGMYNNTITQEIGEHGEGKIPPITAGGGVVIAFGLILVILAMFGALRWLKKKEMKKQQDTETARNRYSRIEVGPSARARYDRDQGSVNLGGGYGEEDVVDDDILPTGHPQPGSESRGGPPCDGGGSGHSGPRYQPPP